MPLGLPQGGEGDFIPYIKYNAKAGRWTSKGDDGEQFEVENLVGAIDLANIRTGFMKFMTGVAPEYVYDSAAGANDAEKPDDRFKRGFTVNIFSKKIGGLRELSSNAGVVNSVMNTLYDTFEDEQASNAGKVPVLKCNGVTAVESKHGTNYAPNLELSKWASRPAEFDALAAPTPPADDDEEADEF